MVGNLRALISGALIVSVVAVQTPVFAETEPERPSHPQTASTQLSAPALDEAPRRAFSDAALAHAVAPIAVTEFRPADDRGVLSQRYFGRRGGGGRRATAITAIVLGSAAAITGGALLAYANRPECDTNTMAGGCGYGFKVVGGSVLAGGLVGVTVGALTWPH